TGDVLGAIDIATAFQARAVKKEVVSVEGTTTTEFSAVNGYLFDKKYDPLTLGEDISSESLNKFKLAEILADGELIQDGKTSGIKYYQKIDFSGFTAPLAFKDFDEDEKTAEIGFDFSQGNGEIAYTVEFGDEVNFSKYEKNEKLVLFGNTFYISPKTKNDGNALYLVREAQDYTLKVGEKLSEGGVTVEFIGATEQGTGTFRVNGVLRTVSENEEIVAGSGVYLKHLSVYTIPEKFAIATISIGSKEIKLPYVGGSIEVDGEELDYYTVSFTGSNGFYEKIELTFDVKEYLDEEKDRDYLLLGETLVDPVFGLELKLDKVYPGLKENKVPVKVNAGASDITLEFVDALGNTVKFTPWKESSSTTSEFKVINVNYNDINITRHTDGKYYVDLDGSGNVNSGDPEAVGMHFIIHENLDGQNNLSHVFRIESIRRSGSGSQLKGTLELRDLNTGKLYRFEGSQYYKTFDFIEDYKITFDETDGNWTIKTDHNKDLKLYTKGGHMITLEYSSGNSSKPQSITVTVNELELFTTTKDKEQVVLKLDYTANNEYTVVIDDTSIDDTYVSLSESDEAMLLRELGAFAYDPDTDKDDKVEVYLPLQEMRILVAFGKDVEIKTTGSAKSGSVETQTVKPIKLGAAVLDTEVLGQVGRANMISVGGPAVNRVSAELMGLTYPTYGTASGIPKDSGLIKMFKTGSKVGIVVAGWEEEQSRMAARVLAEYLVSGKYASDLKDKEEVVVTGSRDNIKVTTPQ
ncbi:MAG: S-layer protein, partial [Candidatus Woesearchaeota archaeon]